MLAAVSSFTLVGPLGLPWWTPLIAIALMLSVVAVLRRLAGRGHGFWQGLAVLRSLDGRTRVVSLVLIAVSRRSPATGSSCARSVSTPPCSTPPLC